jgi:hypothetical protein
MCFGNTRMQRCDAPIRYAQDANAHRLSAHGLACDGRCVALVLVRICMSGERRISSSGYAFRTNTDTLYPGSFPTVMCNEPPAEPPYTNMQPSHRNGTTVIRQHIAPAMSLARPASVATAHGTASLSSKSSFRVLGYMLAGSTR